MLCLKLFGLGDIRLVEEDIPSIASDEILLKTRTASICGTDVRMWKNGYKGVDSEHPLTLGHEFAGVIEKVGSAVPYYKPGMRVALQPNIGCGLCDRCVSGNFHLCDDYRAFGINMDGAFAEYVHIPASAILRGNLSVLPDGVSYEEASIAEPLSCVFNGFSKCSVKPGEYAMVIGAGPIGTMHAMLLHMAGAMVFMNDLSEERLALCRRIMPYITPYSGADLRDFVMEKTGGRGLDVAITACPVPQVQANVLSLMNYGGRINFFGGIPANRQPVAIDTNLIHYKELYITGSTRSSVIQFRKALSFMEQGLVDMRGVITDRYAIQDIVTGFENASAAKGLKHIVLF